ncbi:hypothetical protein [Rhodobacter capsulatus]|uniref:hypothetical protein n=1 Tax=Rhodobacter capsulatus TaxID=1061 RepID=UPI0040253A28
MPNVSAQTTGDDQNRKSARLVADAADKAPIEKEKRNKPENTAAAGEAQIAQEKEKRRKERKRGAKEEEKGKRKEGASRHTSKRR